MTTARSQPRSQLWSWAAKSTTVAKSADLRPKMCRATTITCLITPPRAAPRRWTSTYTVRAVAGGVTHECAPNGEHGAGEHMPP